MEVRVCVIEDNEKWASFACDTIREVVQESFPDQSLEFADVAVCRSYDEAVKTLREGERFDIVSVDIDLGNASDGMNADIETDGREIISEIAEHDLCKVLIAFTGIARAETTTLPEDPLHVSSLLQNVPGGIDFIWSKSSDAATTESMNRTRASIKNMMANEENRKQLGRLLYLEASLVLSGNPFKVKTKGDGSLKLTGKRGEAQRLDMVANSWAILWGRHRIAVTESQPFRVLLMIVASEHRWDTDHLWNINCDKKDILPFMTWLASVTNRELASLFSNIPKTKANELIRYLTQIRGGGAPLSDAPILEVPDNQALLHSEAVAEVESSLGGHERSVTSADGVLLDMSDLNTETGTFRVKSKPADIEGLREELIGLCKKVAECTHRRMSGGQSDNWSEWIEEAINRISSISTYRLNNVRELLGELSRALDSANWAAHEIAREALLVELSKIRRTPLRVEKERFRDSKKKVKSYISRQLESLRTSGQHGVESLCNHLEEATEPKKDQDTSKHFIDYSEFAGALKWHVEIDDP